MQQSEYCWHYAWKLFPQHAIDCWVKPSLLQVGASSYLKLEFVKEWVTKSPKILFKFANIPHRSRCYVGILTRDRGFVRKVWLDWLFATNSTWFLFPLSYSPFISSTLENKVGKCSKMSEIQGIHVYRGTGLSNEDFFGKSDVYFVGRIGSIGSTWSEKC